MVSGLVRIERHPNGRRLRLAGRRVHHWHAGLALSVLGARMLWRDRYDLMDAVLRVENP